ncbi:unnamed protein product [Bursaphelenchus xylophilus]|uniref:(pine wood nematode) hypothetical protein n=1 Tax=Bursaphelenchus xylophilus TaxID=6326 RepID=A0A1I7S3H1_BURXY|nr:unnamed protein product [Bursaphelenchus xylophilus]CAG9116306.1 unnamed protein product [Bursaphelenchus xylophilus]
MVRPFSSREPVRRAYRGDYGRRDSPPRRRSPTRRARSPPIRRDFDRRSVRRRSPPVVRRPAKIDPRKYLPPVRNPAKYVDPPGRPRVVRKRSRSPLKNGSVPKRSRSSDKKKIDEDISKLERKLRFDLTDIFTLCIHSDKATHTERLELVQQKLEEIRNEVDALPKEKLEDLELEEVDCEEAASGDENDDTKSNDERAIKDTNDYDEADDIILDQVEQPVFHDEDSNDNNVPKSPPEEDKGDSLNGDLGT